MPGSDERNATARERTTLQPGDHEAFFSILDNPPPPTTKLRDAIARYKAKILSDRN
jgi:uncharacterized protein (DUF1778 family)